MRLKIGANDDPLDMKSVVAFIKSHEKDDIHKEMFMFAKESLSWNAQLKKVFNHPVLNS